jgi:hypothetical protein
MDTPLFSRQISVFGALPHKNYVNNVKKKLEVSLILAYKINTFTDIN